MSDKKHINFMVYVINLERHQDRLEDITEQLNALKIDFVKINAVDGKKLQREDIHQYCPSDVINVYGREMSTGEIACALSHISIYQLMQENSVDAALILEDDAFLGKSVLSVISDFTQNYSNDNDCIYILSHAGKYSRMGRKTIGKFNFYCATDVYGSHGYIISKNTAKILINYYTKINHPIDLWKTLTKNTGIAAYCLVPYCIGHTIFANKSEIEAGRNTLYVTEDKRLIAIVKRKFIRFINKVMGIELKQKENLMLERHRS